jgi:hypothetical protein
MQRRLRAAYPIAGIALAFVALVAWVSALPIRALDVIVLALLLVGLGLSVAGYVAGRDVLVRRVSVIGIGVSGAGVLLLSILYLAG